MARTLELDTIQTPSANNANIQLGSDTVTFSSNIAVDINNATIDGATINTSDITVGPGKTLTVTDGTLTTSATQKKAIIEGAAANVDLGDHEVRAQTFQSDVATGTAPLTVASTTKVTNLNADKLDGYDSSDLFNLDHAQVSGVLDVDHGGTNVSTLAGEAQGTNPETYRRKFFRGSNTNTAAAPAFGFTTTRSLGSVPKMRGLSHISQVTLALALIKVHAAQTQLPSPSSCAAPLELSGLGCVTSVSSIRAP